MKVEQYLRAHAGVLLSGLSNLILLHLSEVTSVGNSASDVGSDNFLEVTESTNIGLVVRDVYIESVFRPWNIMQGRKVNIHLLLTSIKLILGSSAVPL